MQDRLVFCVGLYRSASTWVFNVCREICASLGTPFDSLYADSAASPELFEKARAGDVCIVKSHVPDLCFGLILSAYGAPVIVSVRDPRDCVASLMTQFGMAFDQALDIVQRSATAIAATPLSERSLVLKYESPDWRSAEGVLEIARVLDAPLSRSAAETIAAKFSPKAVKALLTELDEARYFDETVPAANQFHAATHFHPNHVGDGRVGKFDAILTQRQERLIIAATREFCRRFSYDVSLPPIAFGETLGLGRPDRVYLLNGFSAPEDWGVWTFGPECAFELRLPRATARATIHLDCYYGPAFRHGAPGPVAGIFVNDAPALEIAQNPAMAQRGVLTLRSETAGAEFLRIAARFHQIMTPKDAGWNDADERPLGLGLCALRVEAEDG